MSVVHDMLTGLHLLPLFSSYGVGPLVPSLYRILLPSLLKVLHW